MELLSSQHFDAKKEEKLLNRYESFSLLISELHKQIVKISAEEMKKYGLQSPSAHMLLVLYKNGACTAANLSRKIGKNKAEISRTIVELEKKGLYRKGELKNKLPRTSQAYRKRQQYRSCDRKSCHKLRLPSQLGS